MQVTRDFSHYVRAAGEGIKHIDLAVEGVHCDGCMAKIERGLSAIPDVTLARMNLTDRRVALEWRQGTLDPARFIPAIGQQPAIGGFQFVTSATLSQSWGLHFSLGGDGLSLIMIFLAALVLLCAVWFTPAVEKSERLLRFSTPGHRRWDTALALAHVEYQLLRRRWYLTRGIIPRAPRIRLFSAAGAVDGPAAPAR